MGLGFAKFGLLSEGAQHGHVVFGFGENCVRVGAVELVEMGQGGLEFGLGKKLSRGGRRWRVRSGSSGRALGLVMRRLGSLRVGHSES